MHVRRATITRLSLAVACMVIASSVSSQEQDTAKKKKDPKNDPIYKQELALMDRTVVQILPKDAKPYDADRIKHAIFRFGDTTNKVENATVWIWQDKGRPVAVQKIEVNKFDNKPMWTYCFSSLSESLVEVKWPNREKPYASRAPVEFNAIPGAPKPGPKQAWKQQARTLSRQFAANIGGKDNRVQLRLLPKPIHEYKSEELGILSGSIFSLATGTNPSIYLIIELRDSADGPEWVYGSSRATSHAIQLLHKDIPVHTEGGVRWPTHFPTWTFDWVKREELKPAKRTGGVQTD